MRCIRGYALCEHGSSLSKTGQVVKVLALPSVYMLAALSILAWRPMFDWLSNSVQTSCAILW